MAEILEVLVDGGKASAGPPLGPALGPMGVNIMDVVKEVNDKTKAFEGMKVPVKLTIDTKKKTFIIDVGTPPTSALVMKELGLEKGSSSPRTIKIGDLTIEMVKRIVAMKGESLFGENEKARVNEVAGTCVSMGVNIDGKDPKEFQRDLNQGMYDSIFSG
jgi:large subunit ribosomal protein L11